MPAPFVESWPVHPPRTRGGWYDFWTANLSASGHRTDDAAPLTRATIAFNWDVHAKTLTVGRRAGTFPGRLEVRTFRRVLLGPNHGDGITAMDAQDAAVTDGGTPESVTLPCPPTTGSTRVHSRTDQIDQCR